jgi:hypothetical protein
VCSLRLNTNFGTITKDAMSRIPSVTTNARGMLAPFDDGEFKCLTVAWPGSPDCEIDYTDYFFMNFYGYMWRNRRARQCRHRGMHDACMVRYVDLIPR